MENSGRRRRSLIKTLILSLGGLGLLSRFFSPQLAPKQTRLSAGYEAVPPYGALVFRQSRVAIVREGDEVYALDLSCTHLGCTVSVTPTELVCPCHGSRFDRRGEVLEGPADRPLRRLAVEVRGDQWVVLG